MVLSEAFVDVEEDVDAVSDVALIPAFVANVLSELGQVLTSLHVVAASKTCSAVASPLGLSSLAVGRALCSCC